MATLGSESDSSGRVHEAVDNHTHARTYTHTRAHPCMYVCECLFCSVVGVVL